MYQMVHVSALEAVWKMSHVLCLNFINWTLNYNYIICLYRLHWMTYITNWNNQNDLIMICIHVALYAVDVNPGPEPDVLKLCWGSHKKTAEEERTQYSSSNNHQTESRRTYTLLRSWQWASMFLIDSSPKSLSSVYLGLSLN